MPWNEPLRILDGSRELLVYPGFLPELPPGARALEPETAMSELRRAVRWGAVSLHRLLEFDDLLGGGVPRRERERWGKLERKLERRQLTVVLYERERRKFVFDQHGGPPETSEAATPAPIIGADQEPTVSITLTVMSWEGDLSALGNLPLHVDHREGTVEQAKTDSSGKLEYEGLPMTHAYSMFAGQDLERT